MSKSKKIFLAFAAAFFVLLIWASYDISSRTTFPGSKPQLRERIKDQFLAPDSIRKDSITTVNR